MQFHNYAELFAYLGKKFVEEAKKRNAEARSNLASDFSHLSTPQKMELYRFLVNIENS